MNTISFICRESEKMKGKDKGDNPLFHKEDVYDVRACLGTPYSCVNCESKGKFEEKSGPMSNISSPVPLKRCSGCHLVAYCSQVTCLKM